MGANFTVKEFLKKNSKNIKLLNLKKNMGKGHALKKGIQVAKKEWILTSDLDLSVPLDQVFNWTKKNFLKKYCYIYFGSRGHKESIVKAKLYRIFLGKIISKDSPKEKFILFNKYFSKIKILNKI